MTALEKIARGIVVHQNKILLCKSLAGKHYFLPGGHIEGGEEPEIAFRREMIEEIGQNPVTIKKIAEGKNSYTENGKNHDEYFYVYLVRLSSHDAIKSMESHIDYKWIPIKDLAVIDFKPKQSVGAILKSIEDNKAFWIPASDGIC